jgi:hypothetical protein
MPRDDPRWPRGGLALRGCHRDPVGDSGDMPHRGPRARGQPRAPRRAGVRDQAGTPERQSSPERVAVRSVAGLGQIVPKRSLRTARESRLATGPPRRDALTGARAERRRCPGRSAGTRRRAAGSGRGLTGGVAIRETVAVAGLDSRQVGRLRVPVRRGHTLELNLADRGRPGWRLGPGALGASLSPSVDFKGQRRCHFWLREGRVRWV